MLQYPNYYQAPIMQPVPQQNFNQPMPVQNPYMDRMTQLQQYQQNLQMSPTQMSGTSQQQSQMIIGKVVNDFSEITANDVPMNGMSAVFPKNDGKEIQVRFWSADGKIQTIPYKPILDQNNEENTNIPKTELNVLNEDVKALREEITERFDRLEKSWANFGFNSNNIKNNPKAKKGDTEE